VILNTPIYRQNPIFLAIYARYGGIKKMARERFELSAKGL